MALVWLDLGNLWNAAYGLVTAWPLAIALSIGITLLRRPPQPGNEKAKWLLFSNLALLAIIFAFVVTAFAAYQPMFTLIEDISSNGGKK